MGKGYRLGSKDDQEEEAEEQYALELAMAMSASMSPSKQPPPPLSLSKPSTSGMHFALCTLCVGYYKRANDEVLPLSLFRSPFEGSQ